MADHNLRQITDYWHDFGPFRVCSHWVEFDAPIVEGVAHPVPIQLPDGTSIQQRADFDAAGDPVPTRLRSYIGLVIESNGAQVQVRGRLRVGDSALAIELADFPER